MWAGIAGLGGSWVVLDAWVRDAGGGKMSCCG